jgi:Family of unknown function (DUF5677)
MIGRSLLNADVSFYRCRVEAKRNTISCVNDDLEAKSLELLCDMCNELSAAVNSLGGKSAEFSAHFKFHLSKYLNYAAEGFICLRQATPPRIAPSKLLIRPAIEIMFRLAAIQKQPDLLYRIAYSEREEDWKWFSKTAARAGNTHGYDRAAHEKLWDDFKTKYAKHFPGHKLVDQSISTYDLAAAANLADYYDSHYRMYCRYTHGAFEAAKGGLLDDLATPEDNRTMALCCLRALEALNALGAKMPNLNSLSKRLNNLDKLLMKRGEQETSA